MKNNLPGRIADFYFLFSSFSFSSSSSERAHHRVFVQRGASAVEHLGEYAADYSLTLKQTGGCTCGCQIGAWLPDLSRSFFLFFFFLCLRRQGERVEEGAIFQGVGRKWLLLTRFPPRPLHLSRVSLHLPRTHFHMYAGPFVARAMESHTRTDGSAHTHARTQSLCMN